MYTQYDLYVCNKQIFAQTKREDDNIAPKMQNLYKDLKLKQTKATEKTNILEKAKHILVVKIHAQTKINPIKCVTFSLKNSCTLPLRASPTSIRACSFQPVREILKFNDETTKNLASFVYELLLFAKESF